MKQNIIKVMLSIGFLIAISITNAKAQTGKIVGKVTDKATGETLIGLTVGVEGTTKGASTDIEGRYNLTLPVGTYSLTFRYLGYQTKTITGVNVLEGKATNLDVLITETTSQSLKEVVVIASFKQETVGALYAQQKTSARISSGITSDQIKKSPDKNTSEVLKRVSGASMQEGKFLVIRGLADRYNVALINNSLLPSTEPDKRAFSFDIIPSNMIDRIIINKTATPDLPGDFAGGVTQVFTRDIPDNNFLNFSVSSSYNNQTTFKDFVSNPRNSTDFLAFDDGSRSLSENFPSSRAKYNVLDNNKKIEASKLLPNSFSDVNTVAAPNQNYQLTWGKVKNFKNESAFGSIISLNYRKEQNQRNAERESFDGVNFINIVTDQNYKYNTTLGALANFSYKIRSNKISLKNLFNQSFEDNYINRTGFNNQVIDIKFNSSELNQKSLLNSQLEGEHLITNKNWKLDWNVNYSLIKRDQPDLRSILYGKVQGTNTDFSLIDDFSRRFYSDLTESNYGANASLNIPVKIFSKKSNFKLGGLKQVRDRDFNSRTFLYTPTNSSQFDNNKLFLPKETIFSASNLSASGFVLDEITNNADSYSGQTDLNAGFLMLDNNLSEKLRLVWGARLESYSQSIGAQNASGDKVKFERDFIDFLPSLNFSYALTPKTNIRLSGSKTVSRPELRELAPFVFINQEEGTQVAGNPNLVRAQNTNADIRFETYATAGEAFTFSLFYKNFINPIEQITDAASTPDNLKFNYQNADKAFNYGFEIDFRKKLNFISSASWLENLIAFTNFTYLKSEVSSSIPGFQSRALQGLSPFLINAGLQYTSPVSGISVNALYNRIGDRIAIVGNNTVPNIYENGRDVIDFQLSKKILKNKAEIKLSVSDIFNQSVVSYLNYGPNNTSFNRKDDVIYYSFRNGTNFTIGFNYNINL